jgi:hypothetical protein
MPTARTRRPSLGAQSDDEEEVVSIISASEDGTEHDSTNAQLDR